jgi:uncharacterized protein involved in exopolysaccharide biosynthesis
LRREFKQIKLFLHVIDPEKSHASESYSLRDLVTIARGYVAELVRAWRLLMMFAFMGLLLGLVLRMTSRRTYEASLSFMLNEDQPLGLASAIGSIGGLLGSPDQVNLFKILELARTRNIAQKVFFQRTQSPSGEEELLANRLIAEREARGLWAPSPFYRSAHPLKDFRFRHDSLKNFSRLENQALLQVHQHFLSMLSTQLSEKTNIMELIVVSTDEQLAFELVTRLFEQMSAFYISKTVEKQDETYRGLLHKTDSLKALLEQKQFGLAGLRDQFRGGWSFSGEVPKSILDQEIRALQAVYAEALKNREIASFSLVSRTPFIQALDLPLMPLKSRQRSWPAALALGLMAGLLTGSAWIWGRSIWRQLQ